MELGRIGGSSSPDNDFSVVNPSYERKQPQNSSSPTKIVGIQRHQGSHLSPVGLRSESSAARPRTSTVGGRATKSLKLETVLEECLKNQKSCKKLLKNLQNSVVDAELRWKSIRVLGGSDRRCMNLMLPFDVRLESLKKNISRACETLNELKKLSMESGGGAHVPLGYGVVDFEGNTNQAPFVRLRGLPFSGPGARDERMDKIIEMLIKNLAIRPPRIVVSVLGSESDDAGVTDPKLRAVLKNAMLESPDVWVVTDGRNSGVAKLIASIMDEIRASNMEEYTVPVIGIMSWKRLTSEIDKTRSKMAALARTADFKQKHKHEEFGKSGLYIQYDPTEAQHLNNNHTFYFFIDGEDIDCDLAFRRKFVTRTRKVSFDTLTMSRRAHLSAEYRVADFVDHGIQERSVVKHGSRRSSFLNEIQHRQEIRKKMVDNGQHAQEFDDANQHDHFLEGTTQIGAVELVIGGKSSNRNLELVKTAVIADTLCPVVIMKGTGGFADLLSYAYLYLHDAQPESESRNARTLDAMVRKLFQVYSGTQVHRYELDIANAVAVDRKVVNFDLSESDGEDLDKAILEALCGNMVAAAVEADIIEDEISGGETNAELRGRYELHLNMLRYAIGFDRVEEAVDQMEKVEFVYEQMNDKAKMRIVSGRNGGMRMSTSSNQNSEEAQIYLEKLQAAHEELFCQPGADDHYLMLPHHYKLALEWALADNRVDLVKVLVPKVCKDGGDIADFLYGPNETRPGEGYGTTLAELYEYESSTTETRRYLEPILRLDHDADKHRPSFFSKSGNDDLYKTMTQVSNNVRVRKFWSMIVQFLKNDDKIEAPTYSNEFGSSRYESHDFMSMKDGFYPEDDAGQVWCGIRDIGRLIRSNASDPTSEEVSDKVLVALTKDRTLESMYFLLQEKSQEERDLIAYQELMIWAVVMNRTDLAEYFWQMGGHAIANALLASTIYAGIASHKAIATKGKLADTVQYMQDMSDKFEQYAIGVMSACYKEEPEMAQDVLEAKLDTYDWLTHDGSSYDCLDLAELAENLDFISHPACQAVIERKWKGGKSPEDKRIRGELDNRWWQLVKRKSRAPFAKFYLDIVAYLALVVLITYIALEEITTDPTAIEWVVFLWFAFLFIEECRQLFADSHNPVEAIGEYLEDKWNWLDLACYTVYFISFFLRAIEPSMDDLRTSKALLGFTVIMVYYRLLHYLEVDSSIGPKLLIFQKLFSSLIHYVIILMVFIISYGVYVQTILNPFVALDSTSFGGTLYRVLYRPYFQVYGELMLEDILAESDCDGVMAAFSGCRSWTETLLPVVFAIYLIVTSVMIMNMLIADFTMTFEAVFERQTAEWRMQMFKLLQEYETRTLVPPPFNFVYVVYNACSILTGFMLRQLGLEKFCMGKKKKQAAAGAALIAAEHQQIVEVFQDRLADAYLDDQLAERDAGGQLNRIEKLIKRGLQDIDYFKARGVSSGLRAELRKEAVTESAVSLTPNSSGANSSLEASRVVGSLIKIKSAVGPMRGRNGRPYDVLRSTNANDRNIDASTEHGTAMYRFVMHYNEFGYYVDADSMTSTIPFDFSYSKFHQTWAELHPTIPPPKEREATTKWNTMIATSVNRKISYLKPGENRLILHVVTRWKRDSSGIRIERLGKPMMEFVAFKQKPTSRHWMIPEMLADDYFSSKNYMKKRKFRASPAYLLAFHNENLKFDITEEQKNQIDNEVLRFLKTHEEQPLSLGSDYVDFDGGATAQSTSIQWDPVSDPARTSLRVPGVTPLYDGFIDDYRNTGAAFCHAEVYHFHDNGNLFEAFDLLYPGKIHGHQFSEVAWLTLHSSIDLIGEEEEILRNIACKQGAFW